MNLKSSKANHQTKSLNSKSASPQGLRAFFICEGFVSESLHQRLLSVALFPSSFGEGAEMRGLFLRAGSKDPLVYSPCVYNVAVVDIKKAR